MIRYAFWNNKGGVGKSFLSFISACEYAHMHKNSDVYVIDMCPQSNASETLLGGHESSAKAITELTSGGPYRKTIAGYVEARLSSPFVMIQSVEEYISHPHKYNKLIPENLFLICGDYLMEVLAEAIRQTSQLAVPLDAWAKVMSWVKELTNALNRRSGDRESVFIIDCNPSFAVYTQLALTAADHLIIPFTADDSSRRAIENIIVLLYGIGDKHTAAYARISYYENAKKHGIDIPKLHSFISNRVTLYEGKASKGFNAVSKLIKETVDALYISHRSFFTNTVQKPSEQFYEIPDFHSACIVSALTGTPLHKLLAGPKMIGGERVQINIGPLKRYREALQKFTNSL